MDQDLEKLLDHLWNKDPHPTKEYCDLSAKLLIVQELREIKNMLEIRHKEGQEVFTQIPLKVRIIEGEE